MLELKSPEDFCWPAEGEGFFLPYVSILKVLRILWRLQKWVKNSQKILTPDPTSGSDLGRWEPELMDNFFSKKSFTPFVCNHFEGCMLGYPPPPSLPPAGSPKVL